MTHSESLLGQALAYTSRGWPVFPCLPGAKEPATTHGFHDASTDGDQVRYWWRRQPEANVAISTGLPGPDVLDVDQHGAAGNGFGAYRRLKAAGLVDGMSAVVATPGGGMHCYFAGSGQRSGRLPHYHLDFRSRGGYVLAPPSQVRGRHYRLIWCGGRPGELDWPAVTGLLQPRGGTSARAWVDGPADASRLLAWVRRLAEGNRNCGLFWAACRLIEAGQLDQLDDLAAAAAATDLPEQEIARTIASARRSAATTDSPA